MLVLTRKVKQDLCIGPDIRVTLLSVDRRGHASIGVTAPRDVIITRPEIAGTPKDVEPVGRRRRERTDWPLAPEA